MDKIDREICDILQYDGRASSVEIAEAVGVSVSTANDRMRRLVARGLISEFRAVLEPDAAGAGLCAFILIDMAYEGEKRAAAVLSQRPEVLELHHVSGAHSYLAKIRLRDTDALQRFLQEVIKPLAAVTRTESILSLDALKETSAVLLADEG